MELEETAVEKAFKELKLEIECRGMKLLDSIFFRRKSNFSGGCGDYRTLHEEMFASLYPMLKQQVTFGTGKGGKKRWGTNKYTVDFYSKELKTVYEIDGESHKNKIQKLKDQLREIFFHYKGIKVFRYKNKDVEKMVKDRIKELIVEGGIKC